MTISFNSNLDKLPLNISASGQGYGWGGAALDGGTYQSGTAQNVSGVIASGYSVSGGSTVVSGGSTVVSGGSTSNSLVVTFNYGITSGVAEDGGSLAVVGNNAGMYYGTALWGGSLAAVGGATVVSGVVGNSGSIFAGAVTSGPNASYANGPGTALDPQVGSGGYALVGGGGSSFVVKGYLANGAGGLISGGTFNPGSFYAVGLGGTALGGTIGGTQLVGSGGTSLRQLIGGSSALQITNAGKVSGSTAISGGVVFASGGTLYGGIAREGGTIAVASGQYVTFLNAGFATILGTYQDGTSYNDVVSSGGTEVVSKGGTTFYSTVLSGAQGTVMSSGTAVSSFINGGTEAVDNGGVFSGGTVTNNGHVLISSGGYASGLSAYSGGTGQLFAGATGKTITLSDGGTVLVSSGASAGNVLINSGGVFDVASGGVIFSGATINNPGSALVLSSGVTADYLVASGGTVLGNSGVRLGGVYAVSSNGTGLLTSSGAVAGTAIAGYDPNNLSASRGTILVSNGGYAGSIGAQAGGTAILGSGGTVSSFSPISGGTATLLAGGQVLSGATALVSGGYGQSGLLVINSGNSLTEVDVGSGGGANVSSGASVASLLLSSGNATIGAGGYVSRLTVLSGASGVLLSGASVSHVDIGSGGWVSGARISNNNEMVIASSGRALDTIVTYDSGTGLHTGDSYTMISSGGYISGATIAGATPVSSGDTSTLGGLLTIESGATLINTSLGYNARLRVKGLKYSDNWTTSVSGGVVYVTEGSGSSAVKWKMAIAGSYLGTGTNYGTNMGPNTAGFILNDDGQGNTVLIYEKCFLAGSMIRTPKGEKAVERLRKGEPVSICVDGREESREIVSVIQRRARVDVSRPEDMAGWSVLVAKDAFAPGLPSRDLFVTPEHCFYFDGRFIPVRMLVNGASIRYDYSQTEYDYYHIKTEPHSIIWANGVLSESWLDTDEQDRFEPDGTEAMRLVEQEQLSWAENAAAPLEVGHDFVEPLHARLAERAGELGLIPPVAVSPDGEGTTMDPAPRIQLENGVYVQPHRHEERRYLFALPAQTRSVTLHSRTFRPSEVVGPYLDDRRHLGMLVGQISIWTGGQESRITRHLTDRNLQGWDVIEAGPHRWTNGAAELLLRDGPATTTGRQLLSIEVQAGGPYVTGPSSDKG